MDKKGREEIYWVVSVQRHTGKGCQRLPRILSCLVGLKC